MFDGALGRVLALKLLALLGCITHCLRHVFLIQRWQRTLASRVLESNPIFTPAAVKWGYELSIKGTRLDATLYYVSLCIGSQLQISS